MLKLVQRFCNCAKLALVVSATATALADNTIQVTDAAANLQAVMSRDLIPLFIKTTGLEPQVTYGSTGLMAKQLETGEPIDLFLAADDTTIKKLAAKGLLDGTTNKPYAVGQLAVYLRPGLQGRQASVAALGQTWVTKVAVADPTVAPYGAAAIDALKFAGVYDIIDHQERFVVTGNVDEAFLAAKSGNVDAAVTALSLVIKEPKANYENQSARLRYYHPITQTMALSPTASAGAKQFYDFLLSAPAQAIFKQYGYLQPKQKK